jgi:hypothetical protein
MAWLDGELADIRLAEHTDGCGECGEEARRLREENGRLFSLMASLPGGPDLASRVMEGLEKVRELTPLLQLASWLLIGSVTFFLALAQRFVPRLLGLDYWISALVNGVSLTADLIGGGFGAAEYVLNRALTGQLWLPAMTVAAGVIIINLWQKRRLSNV